MRKVRGLKMRLLWRHVFGAVKQAETDVILMKWNDETRSLDGYLITRVGRDSTLVYSRHTMTYNITSALHPAPSHADESVYENSFMKPAWKSVIRPTHSVPGARKVVRKCRVPSFWPKPLPGTMQMPVASSRRRQ